MKRWYFMVAAVVLSATVAGSILFLRHRKPAQVTVEEGYADPATCSGCHATEAAGYARTGMAHAFSRPDGQNTIEDPCKDRQFYHAASETYDELPEHDGRY